MLVTMASGSGSEWHVSHIFCDILQEEHYFLDESLALMDDAPSRKLCIYIGKIAQKQKLKIQNMCLSDSQI